MSNLEELIERLCPDGVEYKEIGSIAVLGAGGDVPKARFSAEKTVEFNIPIYSNGIEEKAIYGYTDIPKVDEPSITISARGTIGWCALRKEPFYPIVRLIYVTPNNEILVDFLKYVIDTIKFKVPKTGIPQLTIPMVSKYKIPVPPLEVQREIVRILDNFTFLTTELAAELAARQKQYEFYSESLINNNVGTIVKLKDIACYGKKRITFSEVNKDTYISVENLLQNKQGKCEASSVPTSGNVIAFEPNDILIGNIRPYLKKIWFADCYGGTNGDVLVIRAESSEIMPEFLRYVLASDNFFLYDNSFAKGGKMPRGSKDAVMEYRFNLPPLEVQQRIVDILDRFDALCNDITSGLPAEIEARQKQYEYYRDKLLTFKELKKEA